MPADQDFWEQDAQFSRTASRPFALARSGQGGPLLALEERALSPAVAPEPSPGPPPPPDAPTSREVGAATRRRASRRMMVAVSLAAVLFAAALGAAISLRRPPSGRLAATPAVALGEICDGLRAGRPSAAYALTTPGYRRGTAGPRFAAMMLRPGAGPARECAGWLRTTAAGRPIQATLMVVQGREAANFWTISLTGRAGSWQVSGVSLRRGP